MELSPSKWLRHPLHPIFVHIPVGLWPAALVFDLLSQMRGGHNVLVQLSFCSIALGLLASFVAVPTGILDWAQIRREKPAWKLGLWHMTLNLLVIMLMAVNLGLRVSTFREAAQVAQAPLLCSILAILLLLVSTYLGGLMVFDQGTSVARFSKGKWRRIAEAGGLKVNAEGGEHK